MTRITALVPMRHSSERVPGKNFRPMAGKPLFHHILRTLQAVPEIRKIAVDTDSPTILSGLEEHFPAVVRLERPEHLRHGEIPMNQVLLHDTAEIESDFYLQTHSTNPLLRAETISIAIQTFLDNQPEVDSLFSVTPWQTRLYWQDGTTINHNPKELLRTQDLPAVYEENSCIYIFSRNTLVEHDHRIGPKALMFPINPAEAGDIDEELDFQVVEFLLLQRQKG